MIAITATSARPLIESGGTIGVSFQGNASRGATCWSERSIGFREWAMGFNLGRQS